MTEEQQVLVFEERYHLQTGEIQSYTFKGDNPHSIRIIQDLLEDHPEGLREWWQHGCGTLKDHPPEERRR